MEVLKSKKRHARTEPVDAPLPKRLKTTPTEPLIPKRSSVDILLGRRLVNEQ
jgi:hypothetical protein